MRLGCLLHGHWWRDKGSYSSPRYEGAVRTSLTSTWVIRECLKCAREEIVEWPTCR